MNAIRRRRLSTNVRNVAEKLVSAIHREHDVARSNAIDSELRNLVGALGGRVELLDSMPMVAGVLYLLALMAAEPEIRQ